LTAGSVGEGWFEVGCGVDASGELARSHAERDRINARVVQ
jgi:hypothetical protein